jgi:hypothetical protein
MAKKKSESDSASSKSKSKKSSDDGLAKPVAKSTVQSQPTKSASTKGFAGGMSMIDTSAAASAAAAMLIARVRGKDKVADNVSVDYLKSEMNKSHGAVAGAVLDQQGEASGSRRPDLPGNPHSKSQTDGHSVSRTNVPRRTGG